MGAHLENPLSRALAGGALDQPVDDFDPPFGSRTSLHKDCIGKQLRQGRKRGETWGRGIGVKLLTHLRRRLDIDMFVNS